MADSPQTCFIAMPVRTTPQQAARYGDDDHWSHVMESLFVPAVEAAGYEPWRPVARGSHLIHAEIVRQLEQADMVLCDMSEANPNVFFELGVRTSVNKPVALVRCDADAPIPFDVNGINTHTYDPSLKAWRVGAEIEALTAHLLDAESSCAGTNPMWSRFGMVLKAQEPTATGTREEALLEVLAQRVDELAHGLNAVSRDTLRHASPAVGSRGDLAVPHTSDVGALMSAISSLATENDQVVEVRFEPTEGFVVSHLAPLGAHSQRFRQQVRKELSEYSVPVRFLSAQQAPETGRA